MRPMSSPVRTLVTLFKVRDLRPPAPFGLAAFLCVLVTPGRGRSFPADRVRTKGGARLRAVVQPHPLAAGGASF